jgi:hypothetical protein
MLNEGDEIRVIEMYQGDPFDIVKDMGQEYAGKRFVLTRQYQDDDISKYWFKVYDGTEQVDSFEWYAYKVEKVSGVAMSELQPGTIVRINRTADDKWNGFTAVVTTEYPPIKPLSERPDGYGMASFVWNPAELDVIHVPDFDRGLSENLKTLLAERNAEISKWEMKWSNLEDALIDEATYRGWCDQYDEFAETHGLKARKRETTVHVTYSFAATIEVDPTDDDAIMDAIRHEISGKRFYDVEESDLSFEHADY